jgi:hypothetical protein
MRSRLRGSSLPRGKLPAIFTRGPNGMQLAETRSVRTSDLPARVRTEKNPESERRTAPESEIRLVVARGSVPPDAPEHRYDDVPCTD